MSTILFSTCSPLHQHAIPTGGAQEPASRWSVTACCDTKNRCRCPYTYVSLRVPLSARLRRRRNYINSRRQNLHALCPLGLSERPRRYASYFQQLPLHICEKACASTFVSRCNAIAVSYCSVVSIYLANDCCAFVCHPA